MKKREENSNDDALTEEVSEISVTEEADISTEKENTTTGLTSVPDTDAETDELTDGDYTVSSEEFVFDGDEIPVFEELGFVDDEGDSILPPDKLFSYLTVPEEESVPEAEENEVAEIEISSEEDGQLKFIYPEDENKEIEIPKAETKQKDTEYNPKKPRRIDSVFDLVELFVFTLLAVMLITSFFFRHSVVEGRSMENTLKDGEHLIISDFFYTPERGDIVVCEDYTTAIRKPIVKRVIAVAGDRIVIKPSGEIYVNGKLLDESDYLFIDRPYYKYKECDMIVPEGKIFVMGDHRNSSTDSRDIGAVSEDSVLGKVLLRFYPFNRFGTVD